MIIPQCRINMLCFKSSNYTIKTKAVFLTFFPTTQTIFQTHISRPFIHFRLFSLFSCNVTAACQIKIINNFSPKTVRFLISIWAWHKEYTWNITNDEVSDVMIQNSKHWLLNILPHNKERVAIFKIVIKVCEARIV